MRILVKLVKYYPIIMNLYISFMMIGYITKIIHNSYLYTFIGQSFYLNAIILILSNNLKFCVWHRLLIYSMSMILVMETFYNFGIAPNYYLYICAFISTLSLLIAAKLFLKQGCYRETKLKGKID